MRNLDLKPQMTLHAHNSFEFDLTLLSLKYRSVRPVFLTCNVSDDNADSYCKSEGSGGVFSRVLCGSLALIWL